MIPRPFDRHIVLHESGRVPDDNCIAVVVTLFNYETYILDCLNSVAAQDYVSIELIIVDDKSTDKSVEITRQWLISNEHRFSRTLLLSHPHNRGLSFARNTGISTAKSKSVFILDADNELYPKALSKLHSVMRETGCAAAYSQLEFFGTQQLMGSADIFRKEFFRRGNYVDAMALFDRSVLVNLGGYEHIEGGWEDYDVWCRLLEAGLEVIYVPALLCRYRVHDASMLRTETNRISEDVIVQMNIRHPWLDPIP